MPARKPKPDLASGGVIAAEDAPVFGESDSPPSVIPEIDRGPGPDQAETRASRWDTPRST